MWPEVLKILDGGRVRMSEERERGAFEGGAWSVEGGALEDEGLGEVQHGIGEQASRSAAG